MSPQETQLLQNFLSQLIQIKNIAKDPQAEAMITNAMMQQSDAAYLLVQRALLQEQALNAAKAQIEQLQNQLQAVQTASGRSFLDASNNWGKSVESVPRPSGSSAMPVAPQYTAPNPPVAEARPGLLGGRAGSFLGSVAATAAGVAGGAFLFQGIENLLGHHSGSGFLNQPPVSPLSAPIEDVTVNNYYGSDSATYDNSNSDSSLDDIYTDDTGAGDDSSMI